MRRQQRRLHERMAHILVTPAEERTYWNGEPTPCRKVRVIVGTVPIATWWCHGLTGTEREAVEVTYGEQTFYLDNEDGSGWAKVTRGRGMWTAYHASLPDDCTLVEGGRDAAPNTEAP